MKKSFVLVVVLLVILIVCLTGCNTNFKFKELEFTKDNVVEIAVSYENNDKKITSQQAKIEGVLNELEGLDIAKAQEKIADNIFQDSVVGEIVFKLKDKEGAFVMTFAQTNLNGEKVSLLKCEALDVLKIKNMPKDIYMLGSVDSAEKMLLKIFANCMS